MSVKIYEITDEQYSAALVLQEIINFNDDCVAVLQKAKGNEFDGTFARLTVEVIHASPDLARSPSSIMKEAKKQLIKMADDVLSLFR